MLVGMRRGVPLWRLDLAALDQAWLAETETEIVRWRGTVGDVPAALKARGRASGWPAEGDAPARSGTSS